MNQTHPVAANVPRTEPVSGMYMMPAQEHQSQTTTSPKKILQVRGIKGLSITLLVMSCLLGILGIIAVIIEARRSYVGAPIWSGLGELLITSIIGLLVYYKRCSRCMNIAFIVMTIISTVWQLFLFIWMIYSALMDRERSCNPHFRWDDSWWYDDNPCQFPNYARIIVDGLTAVVAFTSMVLCIIMFSLTTYATFSCCHGGCCRQSPSSEYLPYTSVMMVPMGLQNNQAQVVLQRSTAGQPVVAHGSVPQSANAQPIVIAGSPLQASTTGAQPVQIVGSVPQSAISQPLVVGGSPHQFTAVQQPTVVGSAPQPVVVGGLASQLPPSQQLVVAGLMPQSTNAQPIVSASAPSQTAIASVSDNRNLGTQASGATGGSQIPNQPQNWEKF